MISAAMIFAAGFGTRMGQLTEFTPKPMLRVSGTRLIDYALSSAQEAGITRIVVNTHYLAEQLHAYLRQKGVIISHEPDQILDTGGGLRAAAELLGEDTVFTLNPDVMWFGPNPLSYLSGQWNPETMDALLLCVPSNRAHGRQGAGDFTQDSTGQITRGGDLIYGGAQIVKMRGLNDITETVFSLNVLWNRLNASRRLHVAQYPGEWCDIGTPAGITLAERLMEDHRV